jgi:hypothetical protein
MIACVEGTEAWVGAIVIPGGVRGAGTGCSFAKGMTARRASE